MKEEGGRRKEEGGRRKEEGGRRKEEGGRRKEEGGRSKEQGARSKEQGARGKEGLVHEIQKGSVQQECCACGDQNDEPVILMSTGSFLLLHFAFNSSSFTLFCIF